MAGVTGAEAEAVAAVCGERTPPPIKKKKVYIRIVCCVLFFSLPTPTAFVVYVLAPRARRGVAWQGMAWYR